MRNTPALREFLVSQGFTDSFNQALKEFLFAAGYTGALNQALYQYLSFLGYTGTLPEMLRSWELDNYLVPPGGGGNEVTHLGVIVTNSTITVTYTP